WPCIHIEIVGINCSIPLGLILGSPRVLIIFQPDVLDTHRSRGSLEAFERSFLVVKDLIAVGSIEEQAEIKVFESPVECEAAIKFWNRAAQVYLVISGYAVISIYIDKLTVAYFGTSAGSGLIVIPCTIL